MKPQYKFVEGRYRGYELRAGSYHRWFRTFNERRLNVGAKADGHKVRAKRLCTPQVWDDLSCSQMYGKDWKRFTKRKHQWKPV